jgi:MerR family transcriptional regulator, thiopeptide resistance regulator
MSSPADKPKPQAPSQEWLSAAECAARTGLTVRALRVYERQGLITPPRSPNGWRRYGPAELARLNSIVILKSLGLTLSQIKAVMVENPPSLLRILQLHEESWKAKRGTADRALTLVGAALQRLRTRESLSIGELCDLIKRIEANRSIYMSSAAAITRQLINENITPEEERAWATWWAEHPEHSRYQGAFVTEQKALMQEMLQLDAQGESPASPAVQALLLRHQALLDKYKVRELAMKQLAWNAALTKKWWGIGIKARRVANEDNDLRRSDFFVAAMRESPWIKATLETLREIRDLMKTQDNPAAGEFDEPVARFRKICVDYAQGEPTDYIEWQRLLGELHRPYYPQESFATEWDLLDLAIRIRDGHSR